MPRSPTVPQRFPNRFPSALTIPRIIPDIARNPMVFPRVPDYMVTELSLPVKWNFMDTGEGHYRRFVSAHDRSEVVSLNTKLIFEWNTNMPRPCIGFIPANANNSMNMIGHNHKFTEPYIHIGPDDRNAIPFYVSLMTYRRQVHNTILQFSKIFLPAMGTGSYKETSDPVVVITRLA